MSANPLDERALVAVMNKLSNALHNIRGVPKPWPNLTIALSYSLWNELCKVRFDATSPADRINQTLFGTPAVLRDWGLDRVELIVRIPLEEL